MTTPAPDWADEEGKAVYLNCCLHGATEPEFMKAISEFGRAAYERGKAEGERLGYIKGLREAAKEVRGRVLSARNQYAPKVGGEAEIYLNGMWAAEAFIRALAKNMEMEKP